MNGAGYYYCGACLAERPFYGALAKTANASLGLVRHALSHKVFKPVCGECGTKVNWSAQNFLARGRHESHDEPVMDRAANPTRAELLETKSAQKSDDRGISNQGISLSGSLNDRKDGQVRKLTWGDKGLSRQGNIIDSDGNLVGQVRTTLDYVFGSKLLCDGTIVVTQRKSIARRSESNWIEIFQEPQRKSPKGSKVIWDKIASIPFGNGISDIAFEELRTRDTVVLVNSESVAILDANTPTASKILMKEKLFGYCRPNAKIIESVISDNETHLLLEYQERTGDNEYRHGLLAVALRGRDKPTDFGCTPQRRIFDQKGVLLMVATGDSIVVQPFGRWTEGLAFEARSQVSDAKLSKNTSKVIAKLATNSDDTHVTYQVWELS